MLTLAGLAQAINAKYIGADKPFLGASIDTRTIQLEEVYIAIKGDCFNGHQFIQEALSKGASAVIVSEQYADLAVPQIVVKDTTTAIGTLAKAWRAQFNIPVVAVTGSCGKTTTKEMIAAILKHRGEVLYTYRNFNNHLGAPLTLLQLKPSHQFAVLEIGTNHPGEIAYLTNIVQPTVSVITNIRPVHIGAFDSVDAIAQEKSAVYKDLSESGIAIINNDEPYADEWHKLINRRHSVSFGMAHKADVMAEHHHYGEEGLFCDLITPLGEQAIAVPLLGDKLIMSALAASATAMALGATRQNVAKGLADVKPVTGRLFPHQLSENVLLIDDSYNNNPFGAETAISLLQHCSGTRIFVTTHMGELGEHSDQFHQKIGEYLQKDKPDIVLLTGDKQALKPLMDVYPEAKYCPDKKEIVSVLKPIVAAGHATILVKGARTMMMETIVKELVC